ncbi:MAG: hypothetical protein ABTR54_01460 [Candidatus Competibacter sp.]
MRWRPYLTIAALVLLTQGTAAPAHGAPTFPEARPTPAPSSPEATDTASLAALTAQIQAFARDLERTRRFMGAPKVRVLDIGIRDPSLRDLYFHTLTLEEKTGRLLFEVKGAHEIPPVPPPNDISLQVILGKLRDTHQTLRQVMQDLNIAPAEEPLPETSRSFTQLFSDVLEANRQLNQLLERHISPSDVYQELTLAIGYSARLLARYPEATRIPSEPPFEPDKQPKDVYRRLTECLQIISRIFDSLGLAALHIDPSRTDLDSLQPSDVYLIAAMIVSQLDFLYRYLDIAKSPPQPVYPGLKFPAHSYQRAGILQDQLRQLERFLATDRAITTLPARSQEQEAP